MPCKLSNLVGLVLLLANDASAARDKCKTIDVEKHEMLESDHEGRDERELDKLMQNGGRDGIGQSSFVEVEQLARDELAENGKKERFSNGTSCVSVGSSGCSANNACCTGHCDTDGHGGNWCCKMTGEACGTYSPCCSGSCVADSQHTGMSVCGR